MQAIWIRKGKGRGRISIERLLFVAVLLLMLGGGCREEGAAEKAGRQVDEAVEQAREKTEETLEDLGDEVDEAVKDSEEAVRKLREGDE